VGFFVGKSLGFELGFELGLCVGADVLGMVDGSFERLTIGVAVGL
jgi:hypothetical protein